MKKNITEYLNNFRMREILFRLVYRCAAGTFNMPDSTMWVLYYLATAEAEKGLCQQDLVKKMRQPKQTIHSVVSELADNDLIEFDSLPGTQNKKHIQLTRKGQALADKTVVKMYDAECRAIERMGQEKMEQLLDLHREFYLGLVDELVAAGVVSRAK